MRIAAVLTVSSLACLALLVGGCNNASRGDASSTYETIALNPARDVVVARREHAAALRLIDDGKWADAEAALKRSLAADVMFGPAHNSLGHVYFHAGNYYLAAWEFQYASKLMPTQAEPRNNLGLVFEATGKLDDAVTAYDAALNMEPDDPQIVGNAARARFRRGDGEALVRPLLARLLTTDTRPGWIDWAHRLLDKYDQRPPASESN